MGISKMTEILQTAENSNASNKMLEEIKRPFKSPLGGGNLLDAVFRFDGGSFNLAVYSTCD